MHFKPVIKEFLLSDTAYQNACKNSGLQNAEIEGEAAVKRAADSISDLSFLKFFYDLHDFHNQILHEVFTETYPVLSSVQEQETAVTETVQDDTPTEQPPITVSEPDDKEQETVLEPSEIEVLPAATNFVITDGNLGTGSTKEKFQKNMAAIAVLKQIEAEKRSAAPEEQQVLSQYAGWGGILAVITHSWILPGSNTYRSAGKCSSRYTPC